MTIPVGTAIGAYGSAAGLGTAVGAGSAPTAGGAAFGDLLKGALEDFTAAQKTGERAAAGTVRGETELTELLTAMGNAEITLQTVVAVRDRVIQAYQEVMRMPI